LPALEDFAQDLETHVSDLTGAIRRLTRFEVPGSPEIRLFSAEVAVPPLTGSGIAANRGRVQRVPLDVLRIGAAAGLVRRLRTLGLEVRLLNLTSDLGVPVVAAVSWRQGAFPSDLAFGFGCHLGISQAATHALAELGQKLPILLAGNIAHADGLHLLWRGINEAAGVNLSFLKGCAPIRSSVEWDCD
jgi:hypothetical protein